VTAERVGSEPSLYTVAATQALPHVSRSRTWRGRCLHPATLDNGKLVAARARLRVYTTAGHGRQPS